MKDLAQKALNFFNTGMERKKALVLILLALCLLFCGRLATVEADLPPLGVGVSPMMDQGTYSKQAISFYEYGSWTSTGEYAVTQQDTHKSIVLGNLLQIVSMNLFGDNYLGFKFPYFLFALCSFLFVLLLTAQVLKKLGAERLFVNRAVLLLGLVLLIDFPFYLASMTVENSIIRLWGNLLFLLFAIRLDRSSRAVPFALGFISIVNIFFIYFSNVSTLLILIGLLFWLFYKRAFRMARSFFLYAALGALVAFSLAECYYFFAWGQEAIATAVNGLFSFSDRLGSSDESFWLIRYISNGLAMWVSNPFFFSPFLMGLSLIALVLNTVFAFKKKSTVHFLLVGLVYAFFLQAIFANDWNIRKTMCVYPILLVGIAVLVYQFPRIWSTKIEESKMSLVVFSTVILLLCFLLFVLGGYAYRASAFGLGPFDEPFFNDYGDREIVIVFVSSILQAFACIGFVIVQVVRARRHISFGQIRGKHARPPRATGVLKKVSRSFVCLGLLCVLLVNGAFVWVYFYGKPTYTEVKAMKNIGEAIGEEYVTDPLAYSFTLYNDIKPLAYDEATNREYFQSGIAAYVIDYSRAPYVADRYVNDKRELVLIDSYKRSQTQWGNKKNIGIYVYEPLENESSEE